MTRPDPATKLRELHETAERISSNLVELEVDPDRRLLGSSSLRGESAAEWADADQALTELWRRQGLLESLLKQADKLRGSRRADELHALLDAASIELSAADVPLGERQLLESARQAQRVSPDQLLAGMSVLFDRAKTVIALIGGSWQTLIPLLDQARQLLIECSGLAGELGGPVPDTLESGSLDVQDLNTAVTSDPLSVQAADINHLITQLTTVRDELADSVALKHGFAARMGEAHRLLDQIEAAETEGLSAHEEVRIKITPAPAPPARLHAELANDLAAVQELLSSGHWPDARQALETWTARANAGLRDAGTALSAIRAPIEARDQFRGLLDAYQAKAKRLGRLEDPDVAALYAQARDSLYTAPTDLELAAQRVRSYQQALANAARESEVVR